ncbi:MAG: atpH [Candidatus Saccharibacteria bacterium]|nr:atpH [Candidatus Saccharibacteria bacterium]
MKLKLPDTVSSLQDLTSLQLEMREYARWFAHDAMKKRVNAKLTSESPILSPAAKDLLRNWSDRKALTQQDLDELIKTLDAYKRNASTMTITLAAPPTGDIKKTLVGWCRENIAPDVLVTFQFNSTILGGMVVRYGSRVFDWSFRRQILAARNNFPEVLRRV